MWSSNMVQRSVEWLTIHVAASNDIMIALCEIAQYDVKWHSVTTCQA